MAESYSILDCQKVSRKSALLLLHAAGPWETPPTGVDREEGLEKIGGELSEGCEGTSAKQGLLRCSEA